MVVTNETQVPGETRDFDELFRAAVEDEPSMQELFELRPDFRPDLDNDIHPLFRRGNFPTLTLHEYNGCRLALRLASKLVSEDAMLEWWVHAAYDLEVPKRDVTDEKCLEQWTSYNAGHVATVRAALENLAEFVAFDFDIFEEFVSCARTTGVLNQVPRRTYRHPLFSTRHRTLGAQVYLDARFKTYAGAGFWTAPAEAQLRFSFFLAVAMVHEMSHAFGIMVRGNDHEPFFEQDDPDPEWGFAWEMWAFGGIVHPWDEGMAPTATLMASEWTSKEQRRIQGGLARAVVPMAWVGAWFRKEFWSAMKRGDGVKTAPVSRLQIWVRSNRRGSLISDDGLPTRLPQGRKRKAPGDGDEDGRSTGSAEGDGDGDGCRKRPRRD